MDLPRASLFAACLPWLAACPASAVRADDPPAATAGAGAEEDGAGEESAEVAKERRTAERFLSLLERNPRPGTAFDRAYAFYAERGELADLAAGYRARVGADETDGAAWAVLGLVEARRGNDAAAIAAFRAAAEHRPDDPQPPALLARSLVLAGLPDEAAEAYEQALSRDPPRRDLPDLLTGLGRVLQRSRQGDDAAAVWDRLEAQFPGDGRVREQIAAILEEEGELDAALARYASIAAGADDDYRRITLKLKAAGLKVRLGRSEEAVADFEALLAELNPESWLYREVRRGIEDSFLRTDDTAGLTAYYASWVERHPGDVPAMSRLGTLQARQGRTDEAAATFERAVAKAPTDAALRRSHIDLLLRSGDYAAAAEQFAELDALRPDDPDVLRDWGTVYLDDPALDEAAGKRKAAEVWRRLLKTRGDDPAAVTRVADWMRQAGMTDGAKELYAKAVTLAPDDPRYREYLGEYLHVLGEPGEAVRVWRGLAAGSNRTVRNLARSAEVFGGFGYPAEAADAAAAADALDVEDAGSDDPAAGALEFADRLRFAKFFTAAERAGAARAQVGKAEELAETPEERTAAVRASIEVEQAAGTLDGRAAELAAAAGKNPADAAVRLRLALFREAAGDLPAAVAAAEAAVRLDPTGGPALATLADLLERSGRFADAADAHRRLAGRDRRDRAAHLTRVAGLQMRLGHAADALRTAREVVAAAPDNTEHLRFYADLAFRAGEDELGLDALRRAARVSTADVAPLLTLARALADRFRTDEAVALYWRAFERAAAFDDESAAVAGLTELALRTDTFDRLLERLARTGESSRSPDGGPDRETALLLAAAHLAADDPGRARTVLEPLADADPPDPALLGRLASLAERSGDLDAAVAFQRRAVGAAADDATTLRLAGLLAKSGDDAAAERIYFDLLAGRTDPAERTAAIDSLLARGRFAAALRLADEGLSRAPDDWELLFRLAASAARADPSDVSALPRSVDAAPYSEVMGTDDTRLDGAVSRVALHATADAAAAEILALDLPDDAPTAETRARAGRRGTGVRAAADAGPPGGYRGIVLSEARSAFGMADEYERGMQQGPAPVWTPGNHGDARAAAILWRASRDEAFVDALRTAALADGSTARDQWDGYHAVMVGRRATINTRPAERRSAPDGTLAIARRLARNGRPGGGKLFLQDLPRRTRGDGKDEPLSDADLELMLRIVDASPDPLGDLGSSNLVTAYRELTAAGRDERAGRLLADIPAGLTTDGDAESVVWIAKELGREDVALAGLRALAASSPAGRSNNPGGFLYPFAEVLAGPIVRGDDDTAFALLDAVLAVTDPARTGVSPPFDRRYVRAPSVRGGQMVGWGLAGVEFPPPETPVGNEDLSVLVTARTFVTEPETAVSAAGNRGAPKDGDAPAEPIVLPELLAHFRAKLDAAVGADRVRPALHLACLLVWSDRQAEAVAALRDAVDAAPGDDGLRFTLATLLLERGDARGALAVLDAGTPADPAAVTRRERLALRAAAQAGDVERARTAGRRLFGVRLADDAQLELARTMQQLGEHELAEAVLARLRRGTGRSPATLAETMALYKDRGETDTAVEIARTILRRTPAAAGGPRGRDPNAAPRAAAVAVLRETGNLAPLIEDARARLARAPGSATVRNTLADYLTAAGRKEEAVAVLKELLDRNADGDALKPAADRLAAMGEGDAAADLYLGTARVKPELLVADFYTVRNAFRQSKRQAELLAAIAESDLSVWGRQSHYLTQLIDESVRDGGTRAAAVALFEKVWESQPQTRTDLLGHIGSEDLWALPAVQTYLTGQFLPTDGEPPGWNVVGNIRSFSSNGPGGLMTQFLRTVRSSDREGVVVARINELLASHPDWDAGRGLRAALLAGLGRVDEARADVDRLLADAADRPIPENAAWLLSTQFDEPAGLADVALKLQEYAVDHGGSNAFGLPFTVSPEGRLADLLTKAGRTGQARRLLLDEVFAPDPGSSRTNYPVGYAAEQNRRSWTGIGGKLSAMKLPLDALRVLRHADAADDGPPNGTVSYTRRQLDTALGAARAAVTPEAVAGHLRLLAAEAGDDVRRRAGGQPPTFDLLLGVTDADELADSRLTSGLIDLLTGAVDFSDPRVHGEDAAAMRRGKEQRNSRVRAERGDAPPDDAAAPPDLAPVRAALAEFRATSPDDDAALAADALLAFAADDDAAAAAAVRTLAKRATDAAGPAGETDAVAERIGLWWVVGREAARHPAAADDGRVLMDRVVAAVASLPDAWRRAVSREAGALALDRGDREAAETHWTRLLGDLLGRDLPPDLAPDPPGEPPGEPEASRGGPGGPGGRSPGFHPGPAGVTPWFAPLLLAGLPADEPPPGDRPRGDRPAGIPVTTADRADGALQLAALAAARGLTDLSVRAVRESLGGGPPLAEPTPPQDPYAGYVVSMSGGVMVEAAGPEEPDARVLARLRALDAAWRAGGAEPGPVAAALLDVVLPPGRPDEVFLYPDTAALLDGTTDTAVDVAPVLLAWCDAADATAALRDRLAIRPDAGPAGVAAAVLRTRLALRDGDAEDVADALDAVRDRLTGGGTGRSAELACHAAVPALDAGTATAAAAAVLELAAARLPLEEGGRKPGLLLRLARAAFAAGDPDAGESHLDDYLEVAGLKPGQRSTRTSAQEKSDHLTTVVRELIRAGRTASAFTRLGELDSLRYIGGGVRGIGTDDFAEVLNRGLADADAAERFRLLAAWTFPKNRPGRALTGPLDPDVPPDLFGIPEDPARTLARVAGRPDPPLTGTVFALALAAREAGMGDELRALLDAAPDRGEPNAVETALRLLLGDPVDAAAAFDAAARRRRVNSGNHGDDLVLAWAALGRGDDRSAATEFLADFEAWARAGRREPRAHILTLIAQAAAATVGEPGAAGAVLDRRSFGPWRAAAFPRADYAAPTRPAWSLHAGLAHASGAGGTNLLNFRYPLTGTYSVYVEAKDAPFYESHPALFGTVFETFKWNDRFVARRFDGGSFGAARMPWADQGRDGRFRLDVTPGRLTAFVNGRPLMTDTAPPASSPFLALAATDDRRALFRTVRVIGDPVIPRRVDLLAGDRLDAWFAAGGTLPADRPGFGTVVSPPSTRPAWTVRGGVLTHGSDGPGRLTLHRPLFDGDVLGYEFLATAGAAPVSPAVDRVAFRLAPGGVRLEWLPRVPGDGRHRIERVVDTPDALGPVPLRPGDWNRVTLAVDAGRLTVSVNDTPVYGRVLEPGAQRLVSLVPRPGRPVRVRNVTLAGDWPGRLPEEWKPNLLLAGDPPDADGGAAAAAFDAAMIGDEAVADAAWRVVEWATALPAAERYDRLAELVVRSPGDPVWRADVAHSPADPAPGLDLPGAAEPAGGRRVPTGGELVSPVLLLAATAEELARLDELAARVAAAPAADGFPAAVKAAVAAAVDLRRPDHDPAASLAAVRKFTDGLTGDSPAGAFGPALVAARACLDVPAHRAAGAGLADACVAALARKYGGPTAPVKRHARVLAATAALLGGSDRDPADVRRQPDSPLWTAAPEPSAKFRADGWPTALWVTPSDDRVEHRGGGEYDWLFANVPLGETHDLSAVTTIRNDADVDLLAGGLAATLRWDGAAVDVRSFTGDVFRVERVVPKFDTGPAEYPVRVEVRPDRVAAFTGDRELFRTDADGVSDTPTFDRPFPWPAVRARGDRAGTVRDLRATAAGDVPRSVDLAPGTRPAWWVDYYGDGPPDTTAGWRASDDRGELVAGPDGSDPARETLLRFVRPLGTDRETVAYEFFQPAAVPPGGADDPARAPVHPSLGRLAFVLAGDGVKIHRVTDGVWDRTPLTADNLADEPDARRGPDTLPLKSGDWNAVRLGVDGDTVRVVLNDELVFERPLEPANRRVFGLFRRAGDPAARVRRVTLTGDWPRDLPAAWQNP